MPLTALHAEVGVLDATTELPDDLPWSAIYRARPRVPLTCRECSHGLHPKVSRNGMRFFAHDPHAPECSLAGETVAHRLLKLTLASAIRAAGWFADLEVAGEGWRADVLATSPDGRRKMAWEAQLATIHADDVRGRTARMAASGVRVCWVVDRDRPWLDQVPAIQIAAPEEQGGSMTVAAGLGVFEVTWCPDRRRCRGRVEGRCVGHGSWRAPGGITLDAVVAGVLNGAVFRHERRWTTRRHVIAERSLLAAVEQARTEHERHLAAIEALLERQDTLVKPAVEHLWREMGAYARTGDRSPEWAMGVPLFIAGAPVAVICPVVSRIGGQVRRRVGDLVVFVASEQERRNLARVCVPEQRLVLLEPAT